MKLKLLSIFTICSYIVYGQDSITKRKCIIIEHEEYLQQQNPNRKAEREAFELQAQEWIENHQSDVSKTNATITIPVVVHVVYSNATENISDAQVTSAMAVLNADFTRTNADASKTPSVFSSIVGSPDVNWCLAKIDPQGKPTTGIVHKSTTVTAGFGTNDQVKKNSTGGDDAWPTDKYFNIWVCKFSNAQLLGYGEFPTSTRTNTFGFVAGYKCYGTMGTAVSPFNKGRTATHEIGHCLNLRHIWGDATCGSDNVSDTPTQESENYNCPTFPSVSNCSNNAPNGDMFMNYMDYVDDACMNSFTKGQSTRMLAVLNTGPYSTLKTSTVCNTTGINDFGKTANTNLFSVYPNPSNGKLSLNFNQPVFDKTVVSVINVLGEKMGSFNVVPNSATIDLDLSSYQNGVYFVELTNGSNASVQRIVINR